MGRRQYDYQISGIHDWLQALRGNKNVCFGFCDDAVTCFDVLLYCTSMVPRMFTKGVYCQDELRIVMSRQESLRRFDIRDEKITVAPTY